MTIRLYGSKAKAGKALILGLGLSAFALVPVAHAGLVLKLCIYTMPLFSLLIIVPAARILLGHPLLEVGRDGLRSYKLFRTRVTNWSDVRGLVIAPLPTSRRPIPALQILTSTVPIVVPDLVLSESIEDVYRRLAEVPEFRAVLALSAGKAPLDVAMGPAAAPAGAYADLAARAKLKRGSASARSPRMLKMVGVSFALGVVGFGFWFDHYQQDKRARAIAAVKQELGPHLCRINDSFAQRCYAKTTDHCAAGMGDGIEVCIISMSARDREWTKSPEGHALFANCVLSTYVRRHDLAPSPDAGCAEMHQAWAKSSDERGVASRAY